MSIRERSEIDDRYKWNAESVFADKAAWEAACDELIKQLEAAKPFKGRLSEGPAVLADFWEAQNTAIRLGMRIMFYAVMTANCDSLNTEAIAMHGKSMGLMGQLQATFSFGDPELLAIGKESLEKWIAEEPRLAHLNQYLDNLFRQQAHVRTAEIEQIMGMAAPALAGAQNAFGMLTSADMQFPPAVDTNGKEHPVAQGTVDAHYAEPDRELRRTTYENYRDEYLAHKNTLAATYLASVQQDIFKMRVRGYNSSLEASLFANNIPVAVHDSLIQTYKKNIPTWHKYWAVRRKILGVDALQPYDIWAPLTANPPALNYEQAVEWIAEGMQPLGDDYVQALRKGCLEERWVDVYFNKGKRQGAFSFGTYDTHPFIMMSFEDNLGAMSTLAHELGHSMHSYYSRKNQPVEYANYSLFVAEVASNFNQAMVRAHLKQKFADDKLFQIALIEEAMDNFHRYFFIMPTLARFELEVHERLEKGMGMTADDLNTLCYDLFSEGYGDAMKDSDKDRIGITWATFGHLYNNFYVFQYATGISAANMLAQKILKDRSAAQPYLEFLGSGSSRYAIDVLSHAGIDMTSPEAVETTFGVLASMVDDLEKLSNG